MGLYLAVFADGEDDVEIEGVEVGSYSQFGAFREAVHDECEGGEWGSSFPVLLLHPDATGTWTPDEAGVLVRELEAILRADGGRNSLAAFVDVDGLPLVPRLLDLARLSHESGLPIWFQ